VRAFDWLRGLAVVAMIQTHALALLRPELRAGTFYGTLQWIDGLVAPAFIFAAGFSMALTQVRAAAGAPGGRSARVRRTLRRLFEVLLVATLVNWMWFPIFRQPRWILRVDILQCIGLSLLIALPALVLLAPRPRALRWVSLGLAALAFGVSPLAEHVPPPLGHFLNDATDLKSIFPLLPWSGYVYLGAAVGANPGPREMARWLVLLALVGAALWMATPWVSSLYPPHNFWVTDPTNHARRWTQVSLVALVLLAIEQLFAGAWLTSWPVRFIEIFGTSSLAAYFLHEMLLFYRLFGVFSFDRFWRDRCSWPQYWALLTLLLGLTFALTWLVDKVYQRVDQRLSPRARTANPPAPKASAA